ncbi:uncharacterized protein PGRI_015870 [Penicillium griseofulvum]|uniref:Uncharacterized protein n=1 Tax=Penicillium patulum TaxID=5078 RepID=A0A135LFH0_PENPA|nr:uncharacterized protein PGRI_015870 [Penicillium griseofulvum]KXG47717.1 hypothetical protein PGRI_015870 [Penicillium griseofulvum]
MFQCPNCRAFTDLSAEVDDSNDSEEKREKEPTEDRASNDSGEQLETEGPSVVETNSGPPGQLGDLAEENLVNNVENLHLQDDQQTDDTRSSASPAPNSSTDDLARSATVNIPGWQPTQPLSVPSGRQSQLRTDTPVRSETSDDNPLTPRNDSGPLAFDGRAGMP